VDDADYQPRVKEASSQRRLADTPTSRTEIADLQLCAIPLSYQRRAEQRDQQTDNNEAFQNSTSNGDHRASSNDSSLHRFLTHKRSLGLRPEPRIIG